jgi:hypothetical protein
VLHHHSGHRNITALLMWLGMYLCRWPCPISPPCHVPSDLLVQACSTHTHHLTCLFTPGPTHARCSTHARANLIVTSIPTCVLQLILSQPNVQVCMYTCTPWHVLSYPMSFTCSHTPQPHSRCGPKDERNCLKYNYYCGLKNILWVQHPTCTHSHVPYPLPSHSDALP